MNRAILSVDWDYFVKIIPQWCGSYIENQRGLLSAWYRRYIEEGIKGVNLEEEIKVSKDALNFWDEIRNKFNFSEDIRVFVSDSHKYSYDISKYYDCDEVFLFDAHSDLGYGGLASLRFELNCANWLGILFKNNIIKKANIFYSPYTLEKPEDFEELNNNYEIDYLDFPKFNEKNNIDAIHICRSGGWTPPWLDNDFYKFIKALNLPYKELESLKRIWRPKELTFSEEINYLIS
ncbi:arginase [Clostridium sp. Marseille-QA1073]